MLDQINEDDMGTLHLVRLKIRIGGIVFLATFELLVGHPASHDSVVTNLQRRFLSDVFLRHRKRDATAEIKKSNKALHLIRA